MIHKRKIPLRKVQEAFSKAVLRRDGRCMVRDCEPCGGSLECSHFFTKGSSPTLMFYPGNAFAQCHRHHFNHHNRKESFVIYRRWIEEFDVDEFAFMERAKSMFIKYTDELKMRIIDLCNSDRLDELKELVRIEIGV